MQMRRVAKWTQRGMLGAGITALVSCSGNADERDVNGTTPVLEQHAAARGGDHGKPSVDAGGTTETTAGTTDTTGTTGTTTDYETFESFAAETWTEGTTHGKWNVVFDGFGAARIAATTTSNGNLLEEQPMAASSPADTHAVLVRGLDTFGDLDVRASMMTVAQLRSPANAWEMAWFVWNYKDNDHFYYVILKPNGWELGKRDPAYAGGQRFLATGGSPTYPPGAWHVVRVQQTNATMIISADGLVLATFTDRERPYTSGSLALYTEDALVRFDDIITSSTPLATVTPPS